MGILNFLAIRSNPSLQHYKGTKPEFDLETYFNGPIKAWGIIQDRKGQVTRQFDVKMIGTWEGDTGTLKEDFSYYDGNTQHRTWTIKKISTNHYQGTASDIIEQANGLIEGNAMRWAYQMDLEVNGKTFRLTFDDWMYLMNDGNLINRSYIKKFGFTVAELTLFMQKLAV